MTGNGFYFRKRVFGGFNAKDVVSYITELAGERNDLEIKKAEAENRVRELSAEIETLRRETDDKVRRTDEENRQKSEVFLKSAAVAAEFESLFEKMHEEADSAAAAALEELENTLRIIAKTPEAFKNAGDRLANLRKQFEELVTYRDKDIKDIEKTEIRNSDRREAI